MKVAIFGGTFNPIHIGHLIMAQYVINYADVDKILFIPNGNPPHKSNPDMAGANERFDMVRLSIEDNPFFDISDYELREDSHCFTVNTLDYFSKKYDKLYFIIGSDNLYEIQKWYRSNYILMNYSLIVLPREKDIDKVYKVIYDYKIRFGSDIILINMPLIDISSTEIRRLVKENKDIRYMVHPKVEDYIKRKGLYVD